MVHDRAYFYSDRFQLETDRVLGSIIYGSRRGLPADFPVTRDLYPLNPTVENQTIIIPSRTMRIESGGGL